MRTCCSSNEILQANTKSDSAELKLSGAQITIFGGWRRPGEIFGHPDKTGKSVSDEELMAATNEMDLVQDITTDCSVVASLCACTARALKGHGKVSLIPVFCDIC